MYGLGRLPVRSGNLLAIELRHNVNILLICVRCLSCVSATPVLDGTETICIGSTECTKKDPAEAGYRGKRAGVGHTKASAVFSNSSNKA